VLVGVPRPGHPDVEGGNFAAVLVAETGDWQAGDPGPILMAGMIGSRQGWARSLSRLSGGSGGNPRACGEVAWGEGRRPSSFPGLACPTGTACRT